MSGRPRTTIEASANAKPTATASAAASHRRDRGGGVARVAPDGGPQRAASAAWPRAVGRQGELGALGAAAGSGNGDDAVGWMTDEAGTLAATSERGERRPDAIGGGGPPWRD